MVIISPLAALSAQVPGVGLSRYVPPGGDHGGLGGRRMDVELITAKQVEIVYGPDAPAVMSYGAEDRALILSKDLFTEEQAAALRLALRPC